MAAGKAAGNAIVAAAIFTAGDVAAQQLEPHGDASSIAPLAVDRTANAAALGLLWGGGVSPVVYSTNERLWPGRGLRSVLTK
eukprot:7383588-Prymnesium_polylepis.1